MEQKTEIRRNGRFRVSPVYRHLFWRNTSWASFLLQNLCEDFASIFVVYHESVRVPTLILEAHARIVEAFTIPEDLDGFEGGSARVITVQMCGSTARNPTVFP